MLIQCAFNNTISKQEKTWMQSKLPINRGNYIITIKLKAKQKK